MMMMAKYWFVWSRSLVQVGKWVWGMPRWMSMTAKRVREAERREKTSWFQNPNAGYDQECCGTITISREKPDFHDFPPCFSLTTFINEKYLDPQQGYCNQTLLTEHDILKTSLLPWQLPDPKFTSKHNCRICRTRIPIEFSPPEFPAGEFESKNAAKVPRTVAMFPLSLPWFYDSVSGWSVCFEPSACLFNRFDLSFPCMYPDTKSTPEW